MIDFENLYKTVTIGLEQYCGCVVRRSNQNQAPPAYPYISYTVTTFMSEKKGTYGVYEDGKDRKPVTQTWSITALADTDMGSKLLANKAREWLDHVGNVYLNDNYIAVQSVGAITNRDNLLTNGYEYRNGFDVVFNLFDVLDNPISESGTIESISFEGNEIEMPPTDEELIEQLDERLSGR